MRRHTSVTNKRKRKYTVDLCKEDFTIPAVGGIAVEEAHLTRYPLLPPHVVLFEPAEEDIWLTPKLRGIFLNQPLTPMEQEATEKLVGLMKESMKLGADEHLPRWIRPHLTRLLQQTKYKPESAVSIYETLYQERAQKLPIRFADVRETLEYGFMYWHGRDVKCRPLLTLRLGRAADLIGQADAVSRLMLFNMEFAIRHLLVPGRVENWVVIIDCNGIEKLPNILKCKSFGQALASVMGKVYSGRMVWTKIFNFPKGLAYRTLKFFVEGIVSALGKTEKVSFVTDAKRELEGLVNLGQIEQWAGGTAPDLPPTQVFPYRMFASPEGYGATVEDTDQSLHDFTNLQFHEGYIWADCLNNQTGWREAAAKLPLPPGAAKALSVRPVRELQEWKTLMLRHRSVSFAEDYEEMHGIVSRGPSSALGSRPHPEEVALAADATPVAAGDKDKTEEKAAGQAEAQAEDSKPLQLEKDSKPLQLEKDPSPIFVTDADQQKQVCGLRSGCTDEIQDGPCVNVINSITDTEEPVRPANFCGCSFTGKW